MAKAIVGFFRTRAEGERAYQQLTSNGFTREELGFVAGDTRAHETPAIGPVPETGSDKTVGRDAVIGGIAGLAAGMVAVVLPGIGALIAAGPLAGAIGGLSLGAAAGGLVGLLKDHGVSEEEADFYTEGVRRGGSIVTVHGVSDERAGEARKIMDREGAIDVEKLADEQRRSRSQPVTR